jgi:hypothetical protein
MIEGRDVMAIAGLGPNRLVAGDEAGRGDALSDADEGACDLSFVPGPHEAVPDVLMNTARTFERPTPFGGYRVNFEHRPFPTHRSPVACREPLYSGDVASGPSPGALSTSVAVPNRLLSGPTRTSA